MLRSASRFHAGGRGAYYYPRGPSHAEPMRCGIGGRGAHRAGRYADMVQEAEVDHW